MANAVQDENRVFSKLAVLNTDTIQGENLVTIKVTAAGLLKVNSTATISFTPQPVAPSDENWQKVWLFQGSDGLTYPAVATSDGELLIET